jgi:chemotaxis protein methyltransferase CheR
MGVLSQTPLKRATFQRLQRRFAELSGIKLTESKQFLVVARLQSRLEALKLPSFEAYSDYLELGHDPDEQQCFVDLLTTNETYFFREPHHFRFLHEHATSRARRGAPALRVWSAASSTGEEPYSLAMTLLDALNPQGFQIVASDISSRVLDRARRGIFPLQRLDHMPPQYLQRFCERGKDKYEGSLRVSAAVKAKVDFFQHNLMESPSNLGRFDVVFLRNVLIYFDRAERERILEHLLRVLMPHGYLVLGSSESLAGLSVPLTRVDSSIYEKSSSIYERAR